MKLTTTSGEDIAAEDLDESLFLPDFSSSRNATTTHPAATGEIENNDTDTSAHIMFILLPRFLCGKY